MAGRIYLGRLQPPSEKKSRHQSPASRKRPKEADLLRAAAPDLFCRYLPSGKNSSAQGNMPNARPGRKNQNGSACSIGARNRSTWWVQKNSRANSGTCQQTAADQGKETPTSTTHCMSQFSILPQ